MKNKHLNSSETHRFDRTGLDFRLTTTLAIGLAFGLTACTEKTKQPVELGGSVYAIEYKPATTPDVVAEYEGEPVSKSQIFDTPAIADLMQVRAELVGAILYKQCVEAT